MISILKTNLVTVAAFKLGYSTTNTCENSKVVEY